MSAIRSSGPEPGLWTERISAVAIRRDRESFMQIYDHFAPKVRVYLVGLGASPAVAEELAQDALLRVWQRAQTYDASRSALSTWIFRIARNLYIDRLRKEPQWVDIQDDLEEQIQIEDTQSPRTESYAEHAQLETWIEQLPAVQARLIRMSYLESKTHSEIAAELNMPMGTVKSHIRRAFQRLQLAVKGE